jgi:hypothetical protein
VEVLPGRRTISPAPPSQHLASIVAGLLLPESVALGAKAIDLAEHPVEQPLSRGSGDAGTLKLENFSTLALNLIAHALNFAPDEFDVWYPPNLLSLSQTQSD